MITQPEWQPQAKAASISQWTDYLHQQAIELFNKDKTHVGLFFCFDEEGLIAVNPIPPGVDHELLHSSLKNAVIEHNLYGIILICESWAYFSKQNDHTAVQLLTGEMRVSDLNEQDKSEILLVRMENSDGGSIAYWDEIVRDDSGVALGNGKKISPSHRNWFAYHSDNIC